MMWGVGIGGDWGGGECDVHYHYYYYSAVNIHRGGYLTRAPIREHISRLRRSGEPPRPSVHLPSRVPKRPSKADLMLTTILSYPILPYPVHPTPRNPPNHNQHCVSDETRIGSRTQQSQAGYKHKYRMPNQALTQPASQPLKRNEMQWMNECIYAASSCAAPRVMFHEPPLRPCLSAAAGKKTKKQEQEKKQRKKKTNRLLPSAVQQTALPRAVLASLKPNTAGHSASLGFVFLR